MFLRKRLCGLGLGLLLILTGAGCTTIAQVTDLSEPACHEQFTRQLSSILVAQGEKQDVADSLARQNAGWLAAGMLGPRPFFVSSPSGADYTFFVQLKKSRCLLRLYARQKGFVSYSNNLTYIETRPLEGCSCAE